MSADKQRKDSPEPFDKNITRWDHVGRQLLADQLVLAGDDAKATMHSASSTLQRDEELSAEEISDMRKALEYTLYLLRLAQESSPEISRLQEPHTFINKKGREEFGEAARKENIRSE